MTMNHILDRLEHLEDLNRQIRERLTTVNVDQNMVTYWLKSVEGLAGATQSLLAAVKLFRPTSLGTELSEEDSLHRFLLERDAHFESDEYRSFLRSLEDLEDAESDPASD